MGSIPCNCPVSRGEFEQCIGGGDNCFDGWSEIIPMVNVATGEKPILIPQQTHIPYNGPVVSIPDSHLYRKKYIQEDKSQYVPENVLSDISDKHDLDCYKTNNNLTDILPSYISTELGYI